MINIKEDITKKCPGDTSLFVSFKYNPDIVSIIKQCDGSVYDKKNTQWEVPCSELSKLLNQLKIYDNIQLDLLPSDIDVTSDVKLPTFKTKPFEYQLDGIRYGLQEGHEKWLLTDAPGLGKSLQILYIAQELKKQKKIEHCLIICGINTLKTNWKKEVEKHTDLSCRILGERVNKKGIVNYAGVKERLEELKHKIDEFFVIVNLETLRSDDIIKEINNGPNVFDMIVMDEVHKCLTSDSLIMTSTGKKPISMITPGEEVLSYNTILNIYEYKKVINTFKNSTTLNLLELKFVDDQGNIKTIKCTYNHLIYTYNRGYVPAYDLCEQDEIEII